MIELTGIGSILRGMSFLYWLLAIALLVLVAWKVKHWAYKAIGIAAVVAIFSYLPAQAWQEAQNREAYAREAWAYFKKLCDEKSGEKIYKTFTGVKSVLVVKPLPPADGNALYDQFWYGDPYSNATPGERAKTAALKLASPSDPVAYDRIGRGFDSVESVVPKKDDANNKIVRYYYPNINSHLEQVVDSAVSRFSISWEDISTPEDRKYWVAGSRLSVFDLTDNSIVAERIGYFIEAGFGSRAGARTPWLSSRGRDTTCPAISNGSFEDRWFILKVLKPTEGDKNGK
ncbi:MAG: hypothetical protein H7X76_04975 [Prolixibacteraceae bacterium]|nr:hypothetical protein [Burkholderiales bacterium]